MMFAKYFEYYTSILRGRFFRGHAVDIKCMPKNVNCDRDMCFLNMVFVSIWFCLISHQCVCCAPGRLSPLAT